jgi:hypothetical protein
MRPYLDKKVALALAKDFDKDRMKYGDEIFSNITDIHKMAKNPRISSNDRFNVGFKYEDGSPRPYWVPILNRIHNVSNLGDVISELSHPI